MKTLEKANRVYSNKLYIIVAVLTALIALVGPVINIALCLSFLFQLNLYVQSQKKDLAVFLAQVTMSFYIAFFTYAHRFGVSDTVWIIFCIGIVLSTVFVLRVRYKFSKGRHNE